MQVTPKSLYLAADFDSFLTRRLFILFSFVSNDGSFLLSIMKETSQILFIILCNYLILHLGRRTKTFWMSFFKKYFNNSFSLTTMESYYCQWKKHSSHTFIFWYSFPMQTRVLIL